MYVDVMVCVCQI